MNEGDRIAAVMRLAIVAAAVVAVATGWRATAVALVAVVLAGLAPRAVAARHPVLGSGAVQALVMLVLLVFAGMVIGNRYGFFRDFWWWDLLLHGAGGFTAGMIGAAIARLLIGSRLPRLRAATLVGLTALSVALAVGAVWEVLEFSVSHVTGMRMQPSLADTMLDLVLDGAGGGLAALISAWRTARSAGSGEAERRRLAAS